MVLITPQNEIDEYFKSERVNQSLLKDLIPGLSSFKKKQLKKEEEDEKVIEAFLIGGAVDCILTAEPETFSKLYYVSNVEEKPSDVEIDMINFVFESAVADGIENVKEFQDYNKEILEAIKHYDWYKNKPGEKRIQGLKDKAVEYFEDLKRAHGKKILSKNQKLTVDAVVKSLRENPRTAKYFDTDSNSKSVVMDFVFQRVIYFETQGVQCKAMLDIMIIFRDSDTGAIKKILIVDVKTMSGSTLHFLSNIRRFRYDIQMAFYKLAVEVHFNNSDIEIIDPVFIVESTTEPGTPLVYVATQELIDTGTFGRDEFDLANGDGTSVYFKPIKGFEELLEEYKYYVTSEWQEDKVIAERDGVLRINWDKII